MVDKRSNIDHFLLLEPVCVLCGDAGDGGLDLCRDCLRDLPWLDSACQRCAIPLPGGAHFCGACQSSPPAFSRCLAPFAYGAPLDRLLQDLKFSGRLALARSLGLLMAGWLAQRALPLPDRLIPVPLHSARLRERGFNQSLELARPIARRLGVPLAARASRRRRNTPPQAELSARLRRGNLKGAFEAVGAMRGHVAIIDDVMTTGSTAQELARTLLKAGATRVDVWVCARAGRG